MKYIRLAIFLAIKDMFSSISSFLFISAALGFLFANVLFVRFMMYGFETSIGQLVPKVSGHAYVKPLRKESYIYNTKDSLKEIEKEHVAKNITPVLEMPCALEYKGSRIATTVWGLNFNDKVMGLRDRVIEGRYFSSPKAKEVILGKLLRRRFRQRIPEGEEIDLGDSIEAFFIKEHNIDKMNKDAYRQQFCKVVGVADLRDYVANNFIFMPIEALRDIVILDNRASFIFIELEDDTTAGGLRFKRLKDIGIRGEVRHWKDRDDSGTDDLVSGFNIIGSITFAVSIICAAILVAFIVFYNTQKKRKATGILRAIGIRDRVFFIFYMLESIFFSIIGVAAGTGIYYMLEAYLRRNPVVMPFGDLYPVFQMGSYIFATVLFIAVSFSASLYYAAKSSKENIIKIVRGD